MLFSIFVSHVNHTVIFELKKLYKKSPPPRPKNNLNYKMGELGVKLTDPVSSCNLDW